MIEGSSLRFFKVTELGVGLSLACVIQLSRLRLKDLRMGSSGGQVESLGTIIDHHELELIKVEGMAVEPK